MTDNYKTYARENGGRVLLLFLLFLLAIYSFVTAGYNSYVIVCLLPLVILAIYIVFRWKMTAFWALFIINYFLQWHNIIIPIPMSLPNEMLQILLLAIAIIDTRQSSHFERAANPMLFALVIWCIFCITHAV